MTQGFWHRGAGLEIQKLAPNADGVLIASWSGHGPLQLSEPLEARTMPERISTMTRFCAAAALALADAGKTPVGFAVQLHDESPLQEGFRFDAPSGEPDQAASPLIPDPYVLGSWGYASLRAGFAQRRLPPWHERLPRALWRGSSTGRKALTPARLHGLPRYRLCQLSRWLPNGLDARFTAVVQSRDAQAHAQITTRLHDEDLLSARCEPWDAALHQWLVEIDGNVNSWGLLWKLLSGSCVLWVSSPRRQWYHHHLVPWHHFVPVAADLSDLPDRLHWCRSNPQPCAAIASQGQHLAQQVVDELESAMLAAVQGLT